MGLQARSRCDCGGQAIVIVCGDSLQVLSGMASGSVHCCITSPPYWGLRAYQGDAGMIGLEPTLEEHIERLVALFREVRRVLRDDGTLWLNYGDAYAGNGKTGGGSPGKEAAGHGTRGGGEKTVPSNLKPKDLMLLPARVVLALQADGWWLRSEIIWAKPNPMPESVRDRPTSAHEKVYLMSKRPRYFYDAEAVRTAHKPDSLKRYESGLHIQYSGDDIAEQKRGKLFNSDRMGNHVNHSGANLRNVWHIATAPYSGAHFATFPPALVEPCIKAGTSQKGVCSQCAAPWERVVDKRLRRRTDAPYSNPFDETADKNDQGNNRVRDGHKRGHFYETDTIGWRPTCACDAKLVPAIVLDPFGGAGTVSLVAQRLGRKSISIEISPEYAKMAQQRCEQDLPITQRPNREDPDDFKLEFSD